MLAEDDGVAISPDDLPCVFNRFVRRSSAISGGSSLGPPLARAVSRTHAGRIDIGSGKGRGTRACALLPLAPDLRIAA